MRQVRIPATFMRGGTSNAIVFHERDLPKDKGLRERVLLGAMGSPDSNGRQLNGMGGGISSLSKVCIVGPSSRPDADIDYTFHQIGVKDSSVSYDSNCGNMSSAMGPFAVDEGLIKVAGSEALVRIHNTNTGKIIHARFKLDDGRAAVDGDFELKGVSGTGSPVSMAFRDPAGAITGKLLPTGNVVDTLDVPGIGKIEASFVDAAKPYIFLRAADLGLKGNEMPVALDADAGLLKKFVVLRQAAAEAMGVKLSSTAPGLGFVAEPMEAETLSGEKLTAADGDLTARILSGPMTGALCTAVASRIEGTIPYRLSRRGDGDVRLMQPSGVVPLVATVAKKDGVWTAEQVGVYRTQRRLFDGYVYVPAALVPELARTAVPQAAE